MSSEKLNQMATKRLSEEEMKEAKEERKNLEVIPVFEGYFWLGTKIREGQKAKGFLAMPDCELFMASMQTIYDYLKKLVKHEKNHFALENFEAKEPVLADEDCFRAFHVLKHISESLQGTGFFSIEESIIALNHLKRIGQVFDENLEPELQKMRMEERLKQKKNDLSQQRQKQNNKSKNSKSKKDKK